MKDPATGKYRFIDYDRDSYKVGRGMYKSAAKNAMRVARTETNIAYRRADHERWKNSDFVLGMRVQLSNSHPKRDICDKLAGDYPKDFVFDGWHPQCFCFATPILMDEKEFMEMEDARLAGKPYTPKSKPITDYPQGFKDWVRDNEENIAAARARGTEPYFVKNNPEVIDRLIDRENPEPPNINDTSISFEREKKEISREDIVSRFSELKMRIKDGGYKSSDITRIRTEILNALHSDVPLSDIDILLDKLVVAVDNADAPRIQQSIDSLPPFEPGDVTVEMKKGYTTPEHVAETINKINDLLSVGQKWSEHGIISIVERIGSDASGSTGMNGVIKLAKDTLDYVVSAFDKLAQSRKITTEEADAIATLWHEVNHNRNLWGNIRGDKSALQTNSMELANEFVARHTLGEFYSAIGIKEPPHQELMWRRSSVDYDNMVRCYDTIISTLELNHESVLRSVQAGLYRKPYDSQCEVLVSAIWEIWSYKKNVPTIKYKDVVSLVRMAVQKNMAEIIDMLKSLGYFSK